MKKEFQTKTYEDLVNSSYQFICLSKAHYIRNFLVAWVVTFALVVSFLYELKSSNNNQVLIFIVIFITLLFFATKYYLSEGQFVMAIGEDGAYVSDRNKSDCYLLIKWAWVKKIRIRRESFIGPHAIRIVFNISKAGLLHIPKIRNAVVNAHQYYVNSQQAWIVTFKISRKKDALHIKSFFESIKQI